MMKILKQDLQDALSAFGGEYREIFFEQQASLAMSFSNGETNISSALEGGFSISATREGQEFFVSSCDVNAFSSRIEELKKALPMSEKDTVCALKGEMSAVLDPKYPEAKMEQIIAWTKEEIDAWQDEHLDNLTVMIRASHRTFCVANTQQTFAQDEQQYHTIFIAATGKNGDVREEIYEKISGQGVFASITKEQIAELFVNTKTKLYEVLEAKPSPSGIMDVIIGSESGGTIIHESIGHPLEADGVHRTVYAGKIGEKVAHESVSIIDDPTRSSLRGSYAIDHEGTPAKKTYLIKDGILVSYLHTNKTAKKYNTTSTGHARRQDYTFSTLVRMGNTYLDAGTSTKEELISRVKDGIYVGAMGGGQVNPIT